MRREWWSETHAASERRGYAGEVSSLHSRPGGQVGRDDVWGGRFVNRPCGWRGQIPLGKAASPFDKGDRGRGDGGDELNDKTMCRY